MMRTVAQPVALRGKALKREAPWSDPRVQGRATQPTRTSKLRQRAFVTKSAAFNDRVAPR